MIYYLCIALTLKRDFDYKLINFVGIYDTGKYRPRLKYIKTSVFKTLKDKYSNAQRAQVVELTPVEFGLLYPDLLDEYKSKTGLTLWEE